MVNKAGDDELAFAGLGRQTELLADGEVGAVELLDSTLARIEAAQPSLNAFRLLSPEAARGEAHLEARIPPGGREPIDSCHSDSTSGRKP